MRPNRVRTVRRFVALRDVVSSLRSPFETRPQTRLDSGSKGKRIPFRKEAGSPMERRKDPKGRDTPEKRTMLEEDRLEITLVPLRVMLIGAVRSGTLGDPPEPRGIRRRSPWSSTENPEHPRRAMSQWSVRVVRCASTRTATFVRQRRGAAAAASVRLGLDRARTASCALHRLGCVVWFASHRLTPSLRRSRGVASHLRTRIPPGLSGFDPGLKGT